MFGGVVRLIAGWLLIAIAAALPITIAVSRWYALMPIDHRRFEVVFVEGMVEIRWFRVAPSWLSAIVRSPGAKKLAEPRLRWTVEMPPVDWTFDAGVLGLGQTKTSSLDKWRIRLMLWPLCPIAPMAAFFLIRSGRKRIRKARLGHCPECGYDRAGIAASVPCPECGAASVATNGKLGEPVHAETVA